MFVKHHRAAGLADMPPPPCRPSAQPPQPAARLFAPGRGTNAPRHQFSSRVTYIHHQHLPAFPGWMGWVVWFGGRLVVGLRYPTTFPRADTALDVHPLHTLPHTPTYGSTRAPWLAVSHRFKATTMVYLPPTTLLGPLPYRIPPYLRSPFN